MGFLINVKNKMLHERQLYWNSILVNNEKQEQQENQIKVLFDQS